MSATADITVRRCTVQVVRHGGWSWGPQPQRLVDHVLAALPGLIAEQLADLAPDGASEDVEIFEPVRIAVSLPLAVLLSGRSDALQHVAIASESLPEPAAVSGTAPQPPSARPHQMLLADRTPPRDARTQPMTLAEFLDRLYERGELARFLALLPVHTLEAWYQSLTVPHAEGLAARPEAGDRLAGDTSQLADHVPDQPTEAAAAQETSRSRQLRDAISAIAARISHGSSSGPGATNGLAPGLHDRLALAAVVSAGPQPDGAVSAKPQPEGAARAGPTGIAASALAGPQPRGAAAAATGAPLSGTAATGPQPDGAARAGPQPLGAAASALAGPQPPGAAAAATGAPLSGTAATRPQPPGIAAGALAGPQPPGAAAAAVAALPPGTAATSLAGPRLAGTATVMSALTAAGAVSAGRTTSTNPAAMTSGTAGPAHVAPVMTGVADVASALPFLLLGPLAQTGYLSALGPTLEPAGLQAQTAVFATALAYTVLGPLERAWRRRPEDLAAAAAFAGLDTPVPGQVLTEFARVADPVVPALDAVVTRALAEGHSAGEPLVLAGAGERADAGLLLFDREGLFPVAWADDVAGLLPAWQLFGSPPVLVAPTALGALRGLADAGASFVVATPPARTEDWRRLPPHRLWTNGDDPALARHANGYQQAAELTAEFTQALAAERAAIPLAASPALGRSLLLAAGLGLGTLAWILWREREPTDPLLAMERFATLSARVSFEPDRVLVRLPLGPRHSDLSVHGLLADVHGVPWFGDRVVEFSGG